MWGKKDEQPPSSVSTPSSSSESAVPVPSSRLGKTSPASTTGVGLERGRSTAQIGKSLSLKGEISGREDVYVDGEIEGTVTLEENALTVGPNGKNEQRQRKHKECDWISSFRPPPNCDQ